MLCDARILSVSGNSHAKHVLAYYISTFTASSFSYGGKGTETRLTAVRGRLLVAAVPVDIADLDALTCDSDCSSSEKKRIAWWNMILPQLAHRTFPGRRQILLGQLGAGDTFYVPHDWTYSTLSLEDSVNVVELVLSTEESFEDLAVSLNEAEFNQMKRFLERREEMRRGWRRLIETARQVDKARKRMKAKKIART